MALSGLPASRRTPGIARELLFAQGVSPGGDVERKVLIYGNRTSSGIATLDAVYGPVADDADAIRQAGRRSELYLLYRKYVELDPSATIYFAVATESAGSAGTRTVTFANAATATDTCIIEFLGERVEFSVTSGDSVTTIGDSFVAAFNAASEGKWPATAANNVGTVTITASQLGPRFDDVLNGLRCRFATKVTSEIATTITVGAVSAGTTEDDFSTLYTAVSAGEYYYHVNPKYTTSTPTSTDNGVGEGILMIETQAQPVNGKSQVMIFGLTGTQAQASAIGIDSDANSVRAFFFHAEDNDWTAGMIAAHCAAVMRRAQVEHPAANLTGYTTDSALGTRFNVPDPYDKTDRPTSAEIEQLLKDGITPIAFTALGRAYIVRQITSRSLNAQSAKDYRASEGHITSAVDFFWSVVLQRYSEQKQPFVADDPAEGAKPLPKVDTPSVLRALVFNVIDDLTSPAPLGLYEGPILDPSPDVVQAMKDSVVVSRRTGGLTCAADIYAVQHNLFTEFSIRETGPAY